MDYFRNMLDIFIVFNAICGFFHYLNIIYKAWKERKNGNDSNSSFLGKILRLFYSNKNWLQSFFLIFSSWFFIGWVFLILFPIFFQMPINILPASYFAILIGTINLLSYWIVQNIFRSYPPSLFPVKNVFAFFYFSITTIVLWLAVTLGISFIGCYLFDEFPSFQETFFHHLYFWTLSETDIIYHSTLYFFSLIVTFICIFFYTVAWIKSLFISNRD